MRLAGADIRRFSRDQRGLALNFLLGLGNGTLLTLADTLLVPGLVLAFFVAQLTDSLRLIGLVPAIGAAAWFLPQLVAASLVRGRRTLPGATAAALVAAGAIGVLTSLAFGDNALDGDRFLRGFFVCYAIYAAAAGFAHIPTSEVISKAIPHDQGRLFLRQRALVSGLAAIVAGVVVRSVLRDDGPAFPRDFALLFLLAAVALATSAFLLGLMREPRRATVSRHPTVLEVLWGFSPALADPNFRRFLGFRLLFSLAAIADPFFVIYALRELAMPAAMVGVYLIGFALARFCATWIWSAVAARGGVKTVLQVAALVRLFAPLVALLLPYVAETSIYQSRVDNELALFYAFGLVFVAYGVALGGLLVGNAAYLLEIAPSDRRPVYVGVANTVLAVVAFVPVLGALVIERYGFQVAFLASVSIGLAAVLASGALTDTHSAARPTAEAWRLRRARS